MLRNWLIHLLRWLTDRGKPSPPPSQPSTPALPPPLAALENYQQVLEALGGDPKRLLPILLARDQVGAVRKQVSALSVEQTRRLIALDERLCRQVARMSLDNLSTWRQTLRPPESAWWWFLDRKAEERDLPWVLLTGTLLLLTTTLTIEILKRLWDSAPDFVSIFGTLLTLILTASPLVKRGQDLAQWFFKRISWPKLRFRAEAMAGMATLAFIAVLAVRLLLPQFARVYNNLGFDALQLGDLTSARHRFQRTVALDPDLVVPYYNLAEVYRRINRPDEAQVWYEKAIEHDLDFAPVYRGLGHLHNEQGEHEKAEEIILAGLEHLSGGLGEKEELVIRYELLSDLGWAYFAQEQHDLAQDALEEAIGLEESLKSFEDKEGAQYRLALPHYYLAQIYEREDRPAEAYQQWEDCLRLLERSWAAQEWRTIVLKRLELLEEEIQ